MLRAIPQLRTLVAIQLGSGPAERTSETLTWRRGDIDDCLDSPPDPLRVLLRLIEGRI